MPTPLGLVSFRLLLRFFRLPFCLAHAPVVTAVTVSVVLVCHWQCIFAAVELDFDTLAPPADNDDREL
jgi:hypothetical protein